MAEFDGNSISAMGNISTSAGEFMANFGRKTSVGKIEIDTDSVHADSPEMKKRFDRIATNYDKLNEVLAELEFKIAQDERLRPVKQAPVELEVVVQQVTVQPPNIDENPALQSADPKKPR